jgi:hypothetical protein
MGAIVLGAIGAVVAYYFCTSVKNSLGYDDSLDVFGIHAVAGIIGSIGTGIFVAPALGGVGVADYAMGAQIWKQLVAVVVARRPNTRFLIPRLPAGTATTRPPASYRAKELFSAAQARVKSICPGWRDFSFAITLPMSRIEQAPVSSIASAIASFTSVSDNWRGRYCSITLISPRSRSARSRRPASS